MKRLRYLLATIVLALALVAVPAPVKADGGCTFIYDMMELEGQCIHHTTWYNCDRFGIIEVDWYECFD